MKQKKDLFELLKENANNIEQKPTKKAWDRLEQRLDQHAEKGQSFSIRRILFMAAGVVGLVGLATVILPYLNQSESADMAMNEMYVNEESVTMDEVDIISEEEQGFYKIVEFRRKHQDRLSNPSFKEGKPAKLMVAYNNHSPAKIGFYTEDQFRINLIGGQYKDCIKSISQEAGKVSIDYAESFRKCQSTLNKGKGSSNAKLMNSKEEMQIIGSVRILKLLNFINEVEINIPEDGQIHSFVISRTELSTIPNSPLVNTSKDWYAGFYNFYINNVENRAEILDKFSSIR